MKLLTELPTKLGFGMMRLPKKEDNKTCDLDETCRMVDAYIAAGGKYFDTAYVYEGSEEDTRKALVERYPRESYYLATKIHAAYNSSLTEEKVKEELYTSLERTQAGYFDFYLLHSITAANYDKYESFQLWDFVRDLKARGIIRHYGFSFHDSAEFLNQVLNEHPDAEFVQIQLNYADWENSSVQSGECYEVCRKYGKPVIVMEPVKGGTLADPPSGVSEAFRKGNPGLSPSAWAVRFAAHWENVAVVLSGMSSLEQMKDNIAALEGFHGMSEEEMSVIRQAQTELTKIQQIPCTGCQYCVAGCPQEIRIPSIFYCMNRYLIYDQLKEAREDYLWRPGGSKASDCIGCGQCEAICPQHLEIPSLLEECAELLEKKE